MTYKKKNKIAIIGLMSGTSMDGINAILVYTDGKVLETSKFHKILDYSKRTKSMLKTVVQDIDLYKNVQKVREDINFLVALDHAKIVKKIIAQSKIKPDFIGFHGQTIYHNPKNKETIQVGCAQLLSNFLGLRVIANFRCNDIKNGGQGAPISPIYHKYLLEKYKVKLPACFLNVGGISNLTYWDNYTLIGFDLGPGNCLMDTYVQNNLNIKFDHLGKIASKGKINEQLVDNFIQDKFFIKKYPKSLDKNYFELYLKDESFKKLSCPDAMATLAEYTIQSIILSISLLPEKPFSIIMVGGGMNNKHLVKRLSSKLDLKLLLAEELHLLGEMIEAELIAYLSARFIYKLPITFPTTTGIVAEACGGKLYSPKNIKCNKYNLD